jgi:hypothetical protein
MPKPQVEGHWHSLIENFATSSLGFYKLVKAGIARYTKLASHRRAILSVCGSWQALRYH